MHTNISELASSSLREEILAFAAGEYNTTPEYPWAKNPRYAVLRHADSRKWYGVIMDVPRERLGISPADESTVPSSDFFSGDAFLPATGNVFDRTVLPGDAGHTVDILNVKCDPVLSGSLRVRPGILPAYHMNKENWISILLDGTVEKEQVLTLLDMSYELTASRKKTKSSAVHNTNWLIPANPKYYDIETALAEHPDEPFYWKQSNNIFVGDIVYIYLTAPVSSLLYKCRALEVDIPRESGNKNIRMKRAMKLKLLETYPHGAINRDKLKAHGVYAVRGPRSMPRSLMAEMDEMDGKQQ